MPGFPVEYYSLPSGRCPGTEFLDTIPAAKRRKVLLTLDEISLRGFYDVRACKKLSSAAGLWEIRARAGTLAIRLLGDIQAGRFIIYHAFAKKQDSVPRREIELALHRRSDYISRRT